jgi:hypothetical protein
VSDTDEYQDEEDDLAEGRDSDATWLPAGAVGKRAHASLALGFLAMAPLFLAYEYAMARDPGLPRSHSERALFLLFSSAGEHEAHLRWVIIGAGLIASAGLCFRRRVALAPSLLRIFAEGVVGAILLGPALAYGMRLVGGFGAEVQAVAADTSLPIAARVLGAAAYEELLFRVALYGIIYFLARRVVLFFGAGEGPSRWSAEAIALLASSLAFAAIHLSSWTGWLGPGGEPFDGAIFIWRFLAGVLLALIFRWRGPGVAAWSHGLFNLALLIGAGPETLL